MRGWYLCGECIRILLRFRIRSLTMCASALAGVAGLLVSTNYAAAGRGEVIFQLDAMGTNLIIVTPQQSRNVGDRARTGAVVTTLKEADARAIRKEVTRIEKSSLIAIASYVVKAGDLSKPSCTVVGCTAEYAGLKHWKVRTGRFLQPLDSRRAARVAVLGATVATDIFPDRSPIDQRILINRVPFEVVGVLGERGQGLDSANEDNQIYVPAATLLTRLQNRDYLDSLVLRVNSVGEMPATIRSIDSTLRRRHRIRADGTPDYNIQNQQKTIETLDQSSRRLTFLIRSVGFSALFVSGLGLLGISWIALRDRTTELGTRKALGASARDIGFQILFETLLTSAAGVLLGVGTAWAIVGMAESRGALPFHFDFASAALTIPGALLLNQLAALLLARRATRISPIAALKQD